MAQNSKRSSRSSMRSKQLGQLLVESGHASQEQVALALKTQDAHGGMLGGVLRGMGACDNAAIAEALHKQVQVTEVQCEELHVDHDALHAVSKDFCLREKLCPFESLSGLLCVVMGNPLNRKAVNDLESMTRAKVKTFKAPWNKVQELIDRAYENAPAHGTAPRTAGGIAHEDEPLSLDLNLEGEPAHGGPAESENLDDLLLDQDPDIIPPSDPASQPAGPTGILEIPLDDEIRASDELDDEQVAVDVEPEIPAPAPAKPKPPAKPTVIKGLDTLDSGQAEVFDMAKRPSASARLAAQPSAKPAPRREAKVNVDLDKFDLQTPSETIDVPARGEQEMLDEIEQNDFNTDDARSQSEVLAALKLVPDSYFYSGSAPKNAPRTEELMDIIESLPVAEVLSPNIAAYERAQNGATGERSSGELQVGSGLLAKSRIELQRAPSTPMAAIRLGEGEFHKLTLISIEDPVGEWDWKFTACGPLAVDAFEE